MLFRLTAGTPGIEETVEQRGDFRLLLTSTVGSGDKWYMDEMVLTIRGKKHSLWRAVDQDGNVLDILV